jgi:hypothetical protein
VIKKFLIISLFVGYLNAGLLNAIAVVVNNTVITMYDIDKAMEKKDLSQNQAVSMLIDDILYKQEIEKFDIEVNSIEINDYIANLAKSNNLSVEKFKEVVIKQGQDYKLFLKNIEKRILNQKLISKIARGKLQIATTEDLRLYYENNIDKFKISKDSIKVISFDKVKNKIFNVVMSQREQSLLKEHFETLKITADIKIIR